LLKLHVRVPLVQCERLPAFTPATLHPLDDTWPKLGRRFTLVLRSHFLAESKTDLGRQMPIGLE
jgi:hypothetical protein